MKNVLFVMMLGLGLFVLGCAPQKPAAKPATPSTTTTPGAEEKPVEPAPGDVPAAPGEAPKAEAPAEPAPAAPAETPAEAPKADAPAGDAPKAEAPADAPKVDVTLDPKP